jgi:hypothetical protein
MIRRLTKEERAIRAAILWDVPAMTAAGSSGAAAFRTVLNLDRLDNVRGIETSEDPLATAARGVERALFARQREESYPEFSDLVERGGMSKLLGLALKAWFSDREAAEERLQVAAAAVRPLDDRELKAHYFTKLATFALDFGLRSSFGTFVEEAQNHAGARSALGAQLSVVAFNYLGHRSPIPRRFPRADLTDLPWVTALALHAAQDRLANSVMNTANPHRTTLHVGRTSGDDLRAAELQATWAGAVWLLPRLRQQLGAQLLTERLVDAQKSVEGVAFWVLGTGKDIASVAALAEKNFDASSADELLTQHLLLGSRLPSEERFVETALAVWDLISSETARRLLEVTAPGGRYPFDRERHSLWAVLALRVPDDWRERFTTFPSVTQEGILCSMSSGFAPRLSRPAARLLLDRAEAILQHGGADPGAMQNLCLLYASLLDRLYRSSRSAPRPLPGDVLSNAWPSTVAKIAFNYEGLVSQDSLAGAIDALMAEAARRLKEEQLGRHAVGGQSPLVALGLALSTSGWRREEGVDLLVQAAMDAEAPGNIRFDALTALNVVLKAIDQRDAVIAAISASPRQVSGHFFSGVDDDLLSAMLLVVRAQASEPTIELRDLVSRTRHHDARVRECAVDAAQNLLQAGHTGLGEPVLLTSLFDAAEPVLLAAIQAVGKVDLLTPSLRSSIEERLSELFDQQGRHVRTAVVVASRSMGATEGGPLSKVLSQAKKDRSWLVRTAAETRR